MKPGVTPGTKKTQRMRVKHGIKKMILGMLEVSLVLQGQKMSNEPNHKQEAGPGLDINQGEVKTSLQLMEQDPEFDQVVRNRQLSKSFMIHRHLGMAKILKRIYLGTSKPWRRGYGLLKLLRISKVLLC